MQRNYIIFYLFCTFCAGCNSVIDKLTHINKSPEMAPVKVIAPINRAINYRRMENSYQNGSLWQTDNTTFGKDQRAHVVGDIINIKIDLSDEVNWSNSTTLSRNTDGRSNILNYIGATGFVKDNFGQAADNLMMSNPTHAGGGAIKRTESVKMKVAAIVVGILPNGNFVIQGRQQILVNTELRDLCISGIVRRADIASDNTVPYEKIAEARIRYAGKGNISNQQQPRYGHQLMDILLPF